MILFFSLFFSPPPKTIRSLKSHELNGEQRQTAARCYTSGDGRFTGGGKEEEEDEDEQEEDEEEVEEEEDAACTTNPKTATSSCMVCWEINEHNYISSILKRTNKQESQRKRLHGQRS